MANERTLETIKSELAAVNSALSTLIAAPDSKLIDYTHAGTHYGKSARLGELRHLRESLLEELRGYPAFEEMVIDDPDILD